MGDTTGLQIDLSNAGIPALVDMFSGALRESTRRSYTASLREYVQFCSETGLEALQRDSLRAWSRAMIADTCKLSPNTINKKLAAIRSIAVLLENENLISLERCTAIKMVSNVKDGALRDRIKQTTRTRITPDDMRAICLHPSAETLLGQRDRALLAVLASSGCRCEEVSKLQLTDIHAVRDGFYAMDVLGKTDTLPRQAILSRKAVEAIGVWIGNRPIDSPYVFTGMRGRGRGFTANPLSTAAVYNIITMHAIAAGYPHVTPHTFRRFVGTQLTAKSDVRTAQKVLGHESIETTAKHYVLDDMPYGATEDLY